MAEKRKRKNDKPQKKSNLRRQARRDVRVAYAPLRDELKRQEEEARREIDQDSGRISDIYSALENALAPLGGQYDRQAQTIASDLNTQLGSLSGLLAPTSNIYEGLSPQDAQASQNAYLSQAAPEAQANLDLFGSMGAGAQTLLASDRSRNLGYQTSAKRQVGLDEMATQKSFFQDFRDTIDDLKGQRTDLVNRMPGEILSHLDQLRQQRRDNRLAQSELELRQSLAEKELRQQRQQNDRQMDFAESEIDRKQSQKQIKGLTKDINALRGERQPVIRELRDLLQNRTPGELAQTTWDERLRRERKQLTRKINKKRKRRRKLR